LNLTEGKKWVLWIAWYRVSLFLRNFGGRWPCPRQGPFFNLGANFLRPQ